MRKRTPLLRKKNIKREARDRRFRALTRFAVLMVVGAGLIWGARLGLNHLKFFSVSEILVVGSPTTLKTQEVIERSGVEIGGNLFRVDIQQVQAKLKEHPFFKSVAVQRRLPHTLVLEVVEYTPEFILNTSRFFYVDQDGDIFKDITDTEDPRDFPVLSGIGEDLLTDPQKVKTTIREAVQLKRIYQQSPIFETLGLSEIHFEKNIGYNLYPEKKKYCIKVGLKDFAQKIQKMADHWHQIRDSKAGVSSIDLNYPGKILMTL